jgi:hypothetical protein
MLKDAGDPMIGLTSSVIPSCLLKIVAKSNPGSDLWETFRKSSQAEHGDTYPYVPGFVMDSCTHGNETKHIDDPYWLFSRDAKPDASDTPKPNTESHVVLDLKRGILTVVFVTSQGVAVTQIVFYAKGCIKTTDELLYEYGYNYWRVVWLRLMRQHASYAMETNSTCTKIRTAILKAIGMSALELTNKEKQRLALGNAASLGLIDAPAVDKKRRTARKSECRDECRANSSKRSSK